MRAKPSTDMLLTVDKIQQMVHVVRGQRVMLDFDLARLYGVTTARLNEQVRRNRDRFPEDFAYQLTQQEFAPLMSQIAISKTGRGGRQKLPWAFTEHGVAMLSSVLRSLTAVRVNIGTHKGVGSLCFGLGDDFKGSAMKILADRIKQLRAQAYAGMGED
jgi:hypothetical protein